ncbi:MAG: hypothetical protein II882_07265 [Lachnospiraceae bacterium]|nr:hypothetical protein [Lachnospiraceae bacterium]
MSDWLDFDFDQTIRDFEYTRRAAAGMNRIIDSADFEDMDADMIFHYLAHEMEVVLFPDYLKRYIYEKLKPDRPFSEIPAAEYQAIISQAFSDNNAPYSLTPTTTKKTAMIKLWLTQPGAKRSTVFALGFGLRMSAEDVSDFLTKVLKEEDFDFLDPEETVYWYCFKHQLPYAAALRLIRTAQETPAGSFSQKKWDAMSVAPEIYLLSEENLLQYLGLLRINPAAGGRKDAAFHEFTLLYDRCREIISEMYNEENLIEEGNSVWTADRIRPADLEKVLCSGIPVNEKNNLTAMSASRLGKLFQNARMSRQRISGILSRKHPVERFDLITLLFFIYARTVEPDWPAERYLQYIDGINEILGRCQMQGIYPANPYEAFVLMCIVAEFPLDVYAQVWEMSYDDGQE